MSTETVFRSPHASCRVAFDPKKHGWDEADSYMTDQVGNFVMGPNGEPKRTPVPFKPVKFENGEYRTADEGEIARLRQHKANGEYFWEETGGKSADVAFLLGKTQVIAPEPMTDGDRELLARVRGYSQNVPPKAADSAKDVLSQVLERFRVRGITVPDRAVPKNLKARFVMLEEAMVDAGVMEARGSGETEEESA